MTDSRVRAKLSDVSAESDGNVPISILSMHYTPETTGNAPYTGALATGLAARAHRVTAFVAHPHYPEWKIRSGYGQWRRTEVTEGVEVHRFRHFVPRPPRGLRRFLSELSFGARLFFGGIAASDTVVIAVTPALFATALATLRIRLTRARPSLIVWVQDIYTLGMAETGQGSAFSTAVTKFVERWVLRVADRVVVIHPRFGEFLSEEFGIEHERLVVIRNWTHLKPTGVLSKRDARAEIGWPVSDLLAVHTGNMGAKQGLENIVEAARLADACEAPITFVLVGDGSERARLQRLAHGIARIKFVEPLGDSEYRRALAAADCLLVNELPGVANMAVPSKLTSYFDAARPVLAAANSDGITANEIHRAGAGTVVSAGDPKALLEAALQLAQDTTGAEKYGASARQYRSDFLTAEVAIAAFERVVSDVSAERARR